MPAAETRSTTFTQRSKLLRSSGRNAVVRSSLPLALVLLWQGRQCRRRKPWAAGGIAGFGGAWEAAGTLPCPTEAANRSSAPPPGGSSPSEERQVDAAFPRAFPDAPVSRLPWIIEGTLPCTTRSDARPGRLRGRR